MKILHYILIATSITLILGCFKTCQEIKENESKKLAIQAKSKVPKEPTYYECKVEVHGFDFKEEVHIIDVYDDTVNVFLRGKTLMYIKYLNKNRGLIGQSVILGTNVKHFDLIEAKPHYLQF